MHVCLLTYAAILIDDVFVSSFVGSLFFDLVVTPTVISIKKNIMGRRYPKNKNTRRKKPCKQQPERVRRHVISSTDKAPQTGLWTNIFYVLLQKDDFWERYWLHVSVLALFWGVVMWHLPSYQPELRDSYKIDRLVYDFNIGYMADGWPHDEQAGEEDHLFRILICGLTVILFGVMVVTMILAAREDQLGTEWDDGNDDFTD